MIMSFTDMVRASVDGIPVNVSKSATSADLINAVGQNPNARNLVLCNDDHTVDYIPPNRRIKPKNGQRFETEIASSGG
jgi:hypothetical protein